MKMKKQDIDALRSVQVNKAIRRAEKLEKTLLKVVSQSEPLSASEAFLKAVRRGLKNLRKETQSQNTSKPESKEDHRDPLDRPPAVPMKRAARTKKSSGNLPASGADRA